VKQYLVNSTLICSCINNPLRGDHGIRAAIGTASVTGKSIRGGSKKGICNTLNPKGVEQRALKQFGSMDGLILSNISSLNIQVPSPNRKLLGCKKRAPLDPGPSF